MRIDAPLFAALLLCAPVSAQTPSDWLSDSVMQMHTVPRDEPPVSGSALPPDVTVAPIGHVPPDELGLRAAVRPDLPQPLWSASTMADLGPRFGGLDPPRLRPIQALLNDLLAVAAAPPERSRDGREMFLARIDALLAIGRVDTARALLGKTGLAREDLVRRWFDIALLTGNENAACARLGALPEVAPTYAARIFCLARLGDWPAAFVTLGSAKALQVTPPAEADRLMRFLDDFESGPILPPPPQVTPLDHALYAAIGEPLRTPALPLAFAHADLRPVIGWKARIQAAERLARAGAISPDRLWDIYAEREPAASGGMWDRVAIVQSLTAALEAGEPDAVSDLLPKAWSLMREVRLAAVFAAQLGPDLATLPLSGDAARIGAIAGLLSGTAPPGDDTPAITSPELRFAAAVAVDRGAEAPPNDPVALAIVDGLTGTDLPSTTARDLEAGRHGEAILRAIDHLDDAANGNLDAIRDGLAILTRAGLRDVAVQAALSLYLDPAVE